MELIMIPFLVKLANILDKRGQYQMAREVDDLIVKLSQVVPQDIIDSAPTYQSIIPPKVEAEPEDVKKVLYAIMSSASDLSKDPRNSDKWAKKLFSELANSSFVTIQEGQAKSEIRELGGLLSDIEKAININLSEAWTNVYLAAEKALTSVLNVNGQDNIGSKAPVPNKKHKNVDLTSLILEAQKLLGVPLTGKWDDSTNTTFIKVMNPIAATNVTHSDFTTWPKDHKFRGKLSDAIRWLHNMQDRGVDTHGKATEIKPATSQSKTPVEPESKWRSKYKQEA